MSKTKTDSAARDIREELQQAIAHLEHVLPAQAPIRDFVHHNTLHAFQQLDFPEAIAAARQVTGASGYLPQQRFREFYRQGRIDDDDIDQVLDNDESIASTEIIADIQQRQLTRKEIYRAGMLHPFEAISRSQLHWLVEERNVLGQFDPAIAPAQRERMMEMSCRFGLASEEEVVEDLWSACLQKLDLQHFIIHPEDMVDLSAGRAESMFSDLAKAEESDDSYQLLMHHLVRKEAERLLASRLDSIGDELTLAGFLKSITGEDILAELRPLIIRHVGLYLDDGMAAWPYIDGDKGFYHAWRHIARHDLSPVLDDLRDWHDTLEGLSDDPLETLLFELRRCGVPRARWASYLERLALQLPGWAGMFNWKANHGGDATVSMVDYLAVCLVMERLLAQRLCGRLWQLEASVHMFRWHFRKHRSEFIVRHALFNSNLPEYLASRAQNLVQRQYSSAHVYQDWIDVSDMIWTWQNSVAADRPKGYSVHDSAWRLFRLAQHLALPGCFICELDSAQLEAIFSALELAQGDRGNYLWLQAYERHYREQIFSAVAANRGRGRWRKRDALRPMAQIVFCMDDREEGIRRHLEEIQPRIETLGAAGFFGVAMNWRSIDDTRDTPLCPIVVTPAHAVYEHPQAGQEAVREAHTRRRGLRLRLEDLVSQESRRNVLGSALLIAAGAPLALASLTARLLLPGRFGRWLQAQREQFDVPVDTLVQINAHNDEPATVDNPREGFTDQEQAERVANFLRTVGLVSGYAPFVILMGHGSSSQNNPHMSAYSCGACSGRSGGPNARSFAAMANRPEVRALLAQQGLVIPSDTLFLGAEHNTCDEVIEWYDMARLDDATHAAWRRIDDDLQQACRRSAHERSRRFMSAPLDMDEHSALAHVVARSHDFSQARPELGHATNATAFIGRRALSQGAFFDRRAFLISYDPSTDPEGRIVEAILLAAGPVGAGINLEYYFSTVNNDEYGCGTKVVHNLTGLFGVMEGAGSDLRTGLPQQMIEIHEAMRLLVLVEATTEILGQIYARQPVIQELVGNNWVQLGAIDPDNGDISLFVAGKGFVAWQGKGDGLALRHCSRDHYQGQRDHLSPALIDNEPLVDSRHA